MITFLKKIHDALDNDPNSEVIAFYTDFSKTFDKVPHFELLKKVASIGVGGCLLQVLIDYLSNRKQFVRIDNTCSRRYEWSASGLTTRTAPVLHLHQRLTRRAEVLRPIHFRRRPENPRYWKRSLDHPGRPRQHCNVGQVKQDGAGTGQMCSDNISREK